MPQSGQVVQVPAYVPPSLAAPWPPAIVAVAPFAEMPATPVPPAGLFAGADTVERFVVAPSPGQLLRQAVAAELRSAGEQIGREDAPVAVEGAVQRFIVKASKAGLYWALEVDVAAAVTARRGGRALSHSYVSHCQDVAYTVPGPASVAPLVSRCIANIAEQFRGDAEMARAIGG
jgi:uncharacterized lipoprotein YajG